MAGLRWVLLIFTSVCWTLVLARPVNTFSNITSVGINQSKPGFNAPLYDRSTRVLEDRTDDRDEDTDLASDSDLQTFWRNDGRNLSQKKSHHTVLCLDRVILFHRLIC